MCTVRYVGRFLEEPLAVPWSMVEYLAEALDIVDLSCIKRYTERLMTAYEHAWESRRRGTSEQRLAVRTILIDFVC